MRYVLLHCFILFSSPYYILFYTALQAVRASEKISVRGRGIPRSSLLWLGWGWLELAADEPRSARRGFGFQSLMYVNWSVGARVLLTAARSNGRFPVRVLCGPPSAIFTSFPSLFFSILSFFDIVALYAFPRHARERARTLSEKREREKKKRKEALRLIERASLRSCRHS